MKKRESLCYQNLESISNDAQALFNLQYYACSHAVDRLILIVPIFGTEITSSGTAQKVG